MKKKKKEEKDPYQEALEILEEYYEGTTSKDSGDEEQ